MNSQWFLVIGYVLLAILCLVARERERSTGNDQDSVWPPFWWLTAGVILVMAVGRIGDAGSSLSDLGRRVLGGGYASRRPFQAGVVAVLGIGWIVAVSICWRTPERRRRYLPMGLMLATLAAYAAVRVVSLHQIDAVLYRREIAGIRVGTVTEIVLLILAGLVTMWVPRGRKERVDYEPHFDPEST